MSRKIFLWILCFMAPSALAAPVPTQGVSQLFNLDELGAILEFAEALENQGDYYRAITEYKRVVFQTEDQKTKRAALFGIVRSYYAGKKWEALLEAIKIAFRTKGWPPKKITELKIAQSLALWNLGRSREARDVTLSIDSTNLKEGEHHILGWIALANGDEDSAREYFRKDGQLKIVDALTREQPQKKSPFLAGMLSAILPGSGQLYAGKPNAALGAFVVNTLLIASTIEAFDEDLEVLGTGLGMVSLGFWSGNIYGAVNFVDSHNKEIIGRKDERLARKLGFNQKFKENVSWRFSYPF